MQKAQRRAFPEKSGCPEATIACVDTLLARLDEQWRSLDAVCDHRVQPELFRHPEWMIFLITEFSNSYFAAYEGWDAGQPIPGAWQVAFDAAAHDDISAGQDVLLGSNAHVQHDLPLALAFDELGSMELVKVWREGAWRSAERLLLARTPAERDQVEQQIELTSRLWAETIRAGEMPGYREVRDSYCRA